MTSIRTLMSEDHRDGDGLLAAAEHAFDSADPAASRAACAALERSVLRHFAVEEDMLFPALEQAAGIPLGPVRMMRLEHDDIRGLLTELREAVHDGIPDRPQACLETLLIMIQQHNMKEEGILYPLADHYLGTDATLLTQLAGALESTTEQVA